MALNPAPMSGAIALAPMEGLGDALLRARLTALGGYDWGVTPFVRVTGSLLPARAFLRVAPELAQSSRTPAGTPMRVQLLGSEPAMLAGNAARLARLAPAGIDLNFGCPAPTVNRHGGGAVLLDDPERLRAIVDAVRAALPPELLLTAKMRLGVDDTARALDCARALAGGVDALVVHARTRADGYQAPARWEWLAQVREAVPVPVVANGDLWRLEDYRRCRAISGCADVMLARGAVADPLLALRIRGLAAPLASPEEWPRIHAELVNFWVAVEQQVAAHHAAGRLKQWLGMLARTWPQAAQLAGRIRTLRTPAEIGSCLT